MRNLTFLFNDFGFTDYSNQARSYLRDSFQLVFTAANNSEVLVGLYKPFSSLYLELESVTVAPTSYVMEYYNGSSYQTLPKADLTNNLNRSGFITWEKPSDWASNTENGQDLFWVKIRPEQDSDLNIKGLNIVFSDDSDLQAEQRLIMDQLAKGDSSFIAYHVAARDEIIQSLRNSGYTTRQFGSNVSNDITQWDILEIGQINQASKFLTLSKIMFDVSSNVDDKWYQKYKDYQDEYGQAFKLYKLSLDSDDDGIEDNVEKNFYRTVRMVKV